MFRAAPTAGPDSATVLSMLPALLLLLGPPRNSGIILDMGLRLSRGAAALAGVGVTPKALLFLGAAANEDFSSSAFEYASFSLFFLPRNHSRSAAMIPMIAMIPMARPALAPVDIPPDPELELEGVSDESEVEAAPATAVLEALSLVAAEVRKVVLEPKALEPNKSVDGAPAEEATLLLGLKAACVELALTEGGPRV